MQLPNETAENEDAKVVKKRMPLSFLEHRPRSVFERTLLVLWWSTVIAFAVMLALPFRFGLLRAAMVAAGLLLWLGGAYLYRRFRVVSGLMLFSPMLALAFLALPGKPIDGEHLRQTYVESLQSLEGTTYVWGGETRVGIDCSGLVRGALVDANLREGMRTINPALLRVAASMWWHDCSAKALGENYRGLTASIAQAKTLNDADYATLRPGDIAVLDSGVHTLAYLGNKTWIQADPLPMRVVRTTAPATEGWFVQGVQLLRWTEFGTPEPAKVASTQGSIESRSH